MIHKNHQFKLDVVTLQSYAVCKIIYKNYVKNFRLAYHSAQSILICLP